MKILITVAAASALLCGTALAQTNSSNGSTSSSTATSQAPIEGTASDETAADTSTSLSPPSLSVNSSASTSSVGSADSAVNPPAATLPASSSALGDPAALKAGDTGVVSNGPVPDTAENRAKYGSPMSRAGKMTRAAGN